MRCVCSFGETALIANLIEWPQMIIEEMIAWVRIDTLPVLRAGV
jgi:hypothetical protein